MAASPLSTWPSERRTVTDAATGRALMQWTNSPAKDQHLYFTSPSVTQDDRLLVFLSDRTGGPNLFAIDRDSGVIRQVSDNAHGALRSYVFPTGGERGLAKYSPVLDGVRNRLYFIQDHLVYRADIGGHGSVAMGDKPERSGANHDPCTGLPAAGRPVTPNGDAPAAQPRVLAALPAAWWSALNAVSADGRVLCVPVTDPRAFPAGQRTQWEQLDIVPRRMRELKLVTRLLFFDTDTGEQVRQVDVPFWVTHVQFDPRGGNRLVLSQEGWTQHERPRVWALSESDALRPLSRESADERASHEVWAPNGLIVYHGWIADQEAFIEAVTWEGELVWRHVLPPAQCGHLSVMSGPGPTRIALDGRDGWLRLATVHEDRLAVTPLCEMGTRNWQDQDAHAHPAPTPRGGLIITSDRAGTCNVWEIG